MIGVALLGSLVGGTFSAACTRRWAVAAEAFALGIGVSVPAFRS